MRDDGIRKAGISRWRYRELRAFCRQYDEKRAQAARLLGAYAHRLDGMPHAGEANDPVLRAAMRRECLLEDVKMIEETAREADPVGCEAIIRNAARGIRYEETGFYGDRSSFFRVRERFFIALDGRMRAREERAG